MVGESNDEIASTQGTRSEEKIGGKSIFND